MSKCMFIGFDFSMNKPAMCILYEKKFHFFIWPTDIPKNTIKLYEECNVNINVRHIGSVSTSIVNSQIVLEHTKRQVELANLILNTIDEFMDSMCTDSDNTPKECDIFISSEGLSFATKGDAGLNLAGYKAVLLTNLYTHYNNRLKGLYTYPPISIKSIAGCAGKGKMKDKDAMINAFKKESISHQFHTYLCNGKFNTKVHYMKCVDDIVDSYFAVKTMLKKEGFIK